jgi:hypothetical protein
VRRHVILSATLLLPFVGACHSDESNTPTLDAAVDTATALDEAAMRSAWTLYREKYCARFAKCEHPSFPWLFGTDDPMARCIDAAAPFHVITSYYGRGSRTTPEAFRRCAAFFERSTCDEFFRHTIEGSDVEECRDLELGTLPNEEPCGRDNQCQSGRCIPPRDAPVGSCGRCAARASIGASCFYQFGCESGARCVQTAATTGVCAKYVALGGRCDGVNPCRPTLVCASGTCVNPPADDACDPATGCSERPLLRHCNAATRKCERFPFANLGEACGYDAVPTVCAYGGICSFTAVDDLGRPRGVCTRFVEDGAACDPRTLFYSPCKSPESVCFGGKCQLNSAAQCTPPTIVP